MSETKEVCVWPFEFGQKVQVDQTAAPGDWRHGWVGIELTVVGLMMTPYGYLVAQVQEPGCDEIFEMEAEYLQSLTGAS